MKRSYIAGFEGDCRRTGHTWGMKPGLKAIARMPRAEGRANVMLSRRGWRARYMGAGVVEVGEMKVENITRVGSGE